MIEGSRFGPWTLHRRIARGGMGEVWEASHRDRLEQRYALKLMASEGEPGGNAERRFLDEARIEAALRHPNIVQVMEVGLEAGHLYLAMELLDGMSLGAVLEATQPPLPIGLCAGIVLQALEGLQCAHEGALLDGTVRPIIHRDIKPSNVVLTASGQVKLIDFGIASGARSTGTTLVNGAFRGTIRYASPEQIRNEPIGPRADLFSLALVLRELLLHRPLFDQHSSAGVLNAILWAPIPPTRLERADVPAALDDLLSEALSRDPKGRPGSASVFAQRLVDALGSESVWGAEAIAGWFARVPRSAQPDRGATLSQGRAAAAPIVPGESPPGRRGGAAIAAAGFGVFALLAAALWSGRDMLLPAAPVFAGMIEPAANQAKAPESAQASLHGPTAAGTASSSAPARSAPVPRDSEPPVATAPTGPRSAPGSRQQTVQPGPHARRSAASPMRDGMGWLTVDAKPSWGEVRLNGEAIGPTPVYRKQVKAGRHRLEVVRADGARRAYTVVIKADQSRTVVVRW